MLSAPLGASPRAGLGRACVDQSPDVVAERYRCVGLLGRGAMSDVYRAVDEVTGTEVALKLVRSADPELARRLAQEARALEGFDHPGLVRLRATGVSGDQAYLVMDLVGGSNLAEALRQGPLGAPGTARLGASLAAALAYVHERGIIHRDVKPANVLLTEDGEARLGDFGIARILGESALTVTGTTLGTTAYMAPEQLENHKVGPAADTWSLGLVLLECLTGRRVYEGSASEVVARRMAGPVPVPPDLPAAWRLLFNGMLDPLPDQRLDAAEVASLLATPAFETPWEPASEPGADPTAVMAPGAPDLSAVTPVPDSPIGPTEIIGAGVVAAGATGIMDPAGVGAGGTAVLGPGEAMGLPPAPARVDGAGPGPGALPGAHRRRLVAVVAVLIAAVALLLWLSLRSSPTPRPSGSLTPSASPRPSPSPSPSAAESAPTALAALVGDVASGVAAGTIGAAPAQSITMQAEQAVTDAAGGGTNQAANDLQQAATSIANGTQNTSIGSAEGATLQNDLVALAGALGLSAAATPPSTAPAPAGGPGSGKGKGKHG
jgi:hypothetical protein